MTEDKHTFPLQGVIGIIDSSPEQLSLATQNGLQCIEVRADLLQSAGCSEADIFKLIEAAKAAGLACLVTLRHESQGGTFNGSESKRVQFCTDVLAAGADIIDLEHGTDSSKEMLKRQAAVILSFHDFNSMLSVDELNELTREMEAQSPAAVKIIPTGQDLTDATRMLSWLAEAKPDIRRIGFTMGESGAYSRILALAHGSPVTYASFGKPVAPGQVVISDLLERYHCMTMNDETSVVALLGEKDQTLAYSYQSSKGDQESSSVTLAFAPSYAEQLGACREQMKIDKIVDLRV